MSLKDELLKAKLISKKKLKQLEHEERIERTKIGKEGVEQQQQQRRQEMENRQQRQKQRDQQLAQLQKSEQQQKEEQARILDIINHGKIEDGVRGHRKFYFVASDGKIPFLMISDGLATNLERGQAAIVEIDGEPQPEFVVINHHSAQKLKNIDPQVLRFYQR